MPETEQYLSNTNERKHIYDSSIIRVMFFIAILSVYYILISPFIENRINLILGNIIRETSQQQVNSLSPIFDVHVYAGDYNLSTEKYSQRISSRTKLLTVDPRIIAMNKFLSSYHSPMAPYAETFITEADKYGLDWRLVASISGVESAFGNIIPTDTNNGWGWRGGPGGNWSQFATWGDGIKEVTRGLAEGYGITLTPFDIEPVYCPPCGRNPAHAWANGVTNFMNQLDYYLDNLENI